VTSSLLIDNFFAGTGKICVINEAGSRRVPAGPGSMLVQLIRGAWETFLRVFLFPLPDFIPSVIILSYYAV
jgi:hypothetical protein